MAFAATDAVSGVAATRYRVDGGTWQVAGAEPVVVEGVGDHTVDYSSTDVAGNAEVVRQAIVTLKAARAGHARESPEAISAVLPPQVSGTPAVGSLLRATRARGTPATSRHTYQWLRDGVRSPPPGRRTARRWRTAANGSRCG